ncbi:hypothetical protein OROMI_023636 [Orobanche minor]
MMTDHLLLRLRVPGSTRYPNPMRWEEENDEFQGFLAANNVNVVPVETKVRNVEVALLAAVVSVGRMTETYAVVLKIKAPAAPLRGAPIDLSNPFGIAWAFGGMIFALVYCVAGISVIGPFAEEVESYIIYWSAEKQQLFLKNISDLLAESKEGIPNVGQTFYRSAMAYGEYGRSNYSSTHARM